MSNITTTTPFDIFLLDVNVDKSIIVLYFLFLSFMLTKFSKDQRSITRLSTKCLNFKFL